MSTFNSISDSAISDVDVKSFTSTSSSLKSDLNKLDISEIVELFIIDLTIIGGSVYYLTPNIMNNNGVLTNVVWQGNTYQLCAIGGDGFNKGSKDPSDQTLPTPTISVDNSNKLLLQSVINLGDLVGAKVSRFRTLKKFLDNGSTPDTTQYIGPDKYIIQSKTAHDKHSITFQLASTLDRESCFLPARQILKRDFPGAVIYRG